MQPAKPRKFGIFEAGDHAKDAHLLGVLELGLKANHVPKCTQRIVLAQLNDGIGPAPSFGIIKPDRLHWAITQRINPALRHDFNRHTAIEIGRVGFPFLKFGFFASDECSVERKILLLIHWAVDIVLGVTLIPAAGHPCDIHIDRLMIGNWCERIEKGECIFASFCRYSFGKCSACQRPCGNDCGAIGQSVNTFTDKRDIGMRGNRCCYARCIAVAVNRKR